jgi:uncharacterized membrane protein YfcA
MWEQWKKTAPLMQLMIVAFIGVAAYKQAPVPVLVVIFVMLEVASFLGAWWGARLKRRINARTDSLPLQGKK